VKQLLKKLTGFSIVFLFVFGVLCASLAVPGLAVASAVPGCSHDTSVLEKAGCEHASFRCGFGTSGGLLYQVVPASVRTIDFPKDVPFLAMGGGSTDEIGLSAHRVSLASPGYLAQKIPIHLFYSVLTL
jgi:hypothetical protein